MGSVLQKLLRPDFLERQSGNLFVSDLGVCRLNDQLPPHDYESLPAPHANGV